MKKKWGKSPGLKQNLIMRLGIDKSMDDEIRAQITRSLDHSITAMLFPIPLRFRAIPAI